MARFRIVQLHSPAAAGMASYEIRERVWIWWEYRGLYGSLRQAEQRVTELQTGKTVAAKVVKEYD
jgi:hypothetical protein